MSLKLLSVTSAFDARSFMQCTSDRQLSAISGYASSVNEMMGYIVVRFEWAVGFVFASVALYRWNTALFFSFNKIFSIKYRRGMFAFQSSRSYLSKTSLGRSLS